MKYDVVIIGGALAGGAVATLLKRESPELKILIVEKSEHHGRRVGEATVEVSGYFLSRVLGLMQYLNETQLLKQGMRFWFANEKTSSLPEASEFGPRYNVRIPSFQLDRATVDEEVLRRAIAGGAELRRPANVTRVELSAGGEQVIHLRVGDTPETVTARWVIDASGFATLLARQNGWRVPNTEHPTAAVWSRWKGVKDWDGLELQRKFPEWAAQSWGIRGTATNHVIGYGWWSWWIPLKGGDMSVGIVYDQRLVQFPKDERPTGERLKDFLMQHPVGKELIENAEWTEGDVLVRSNLAYSSTTYAGDGFALVGDAAAFMDPFYSPGMDWLSYTTTAVSKLVAAERRGEPIAPLIDKHNRDFSTSYHRWFSSLYKDKYEYMGDYELMTIAFLLDLGLYYFGIVSQPFKYGPGALATPPFSPRIAKGFYEFMSFYNARLAAIARGRRKRGVWGRQNSHRKYFFGGFLLEKLNLKILSKTFASYVKLELTEGWRTWFPRTDTEAIRRARSMVPQKQA
ncbi:MAG TPA: tryptophan 7-halogenase [Chthoniobacterales bacterium]